MRFSENETAKLIKIKNIIIDLHRYLDENIIDEKIDGKSFYNYLTNIKKIQGNFDTLISFTSCLMAKEYLLEKYDFKTSFDVSLKSQSAPGLDIDEITTDNKRIIGEIKTTIPYNQNDFGANQKENIINDLKKLKKTEADGKYFFVTEKRAYDIIQSRYIHELKNISIILL
jgi:hypothetical protein